MAGRGRAPVRLSPEFIEALRHRYVETDQPVRDIIAEFGISTGRLGRLIEKEGWPKRQDRPPLQLPPALKLLEETRALSIAFPARDAACNAASQTRGPGSPDQTGGPGLQRTTKACRAAPGTQPDEVRPHTDSDPVARIEALVLKEIAAEETVRARLGGAPRPAADAGRGARTLAILTQTLQNLQRLRAAGRSAANHDFGKDEFDDDMPADLDEFRRELARRIEAFVASQPDDEDVADDRSQVVAPARP